MLGSSEDHAEALNVATEDNNTFIIRLWGVTVKFYTLMANGTNSATSVNKILCVFVFGWHYRHISQKVKI